MKRISLLIVEDHEIMCDGLRALLNLQQDFDVVGEAHDGRRAVEEVKAKSPDVVVMDIAMPMLNGLEATRQILQARPATRILILSARSEDSYVEQAIKMGASGFLMKQNGAETLCRAVRALASGKTYFSPVLVKRLGLAANRGIREKSPSKTLTVREAEVLQMVAEGLANKQIASELNISIKTVEKHRQGLMNKLGLHDTASLTRHAINNGVIESDFRPTT